MTPNATINVSVSHHYREATYTSEMTSQGILGERVEIIEPQPLFTRIRQADDYESWISSDQVCADHGLPDGRKLLVRSHFLKIYREPSSGSETVREAVIGSQLTVLEEQGGWLKIGLPDGNTGWAEKSHFGSFGPFSAEAVLALAREFLGYQYVWGGRTPKGFDCSGFVQTVFGLHGVTLPRDSWQQQERCLVSNDFRQARPADLLFFGKTPERVTHVAMSLGAGRFIHASGWVKYNSFNTGDPDYNEDYVRTFVSVNRYSC